MRRRAGWRAYWRVGGGNTEVSGKYICSVEFWVTMFDAGTRVGEGIQVSMKRRAGVIYVTRRYVWLRAERCVCACAVWCTKSYLVSDCTTQNSEKR